MKTQLLDKMGKVKKEIELPENFNSKIREDILLKVFETQKGLYMQEYGAMKGAGAGYSASGISIKARHRWKGTYGKGISRIPRKINKKELAIAFNSALAGTVNEESLEKKYSKKIKSGFVFSEDILNLKTKEFIKAMENKFSEIKK